MALSFSSIAVLFGSLASSFLQDPPPVAAPSVVATAHETHQHVNELLDPDWQQVELILTVKCVRCHRLGADLPDLASYQTAISGRTEEDEPLVVPGRPEASLLMEMAAYNHGQRANWLDPPKAVLSPKHQEDWLTGEQLALIEQWIRNGAGQYKPGTD